MSRKNKPLESDVANLMSKIEAGIGTNPPSTALKERSEGTFIEATAQKTIQKQAQKVEKLAEKVSRATAVYVQQTTMLELVEAIALLDMTVRNSMVERCDIGQKTMGKEVVKRSMIAVDIPPGTLLRVSLPPLLGRETRGAYNIYWKLKLALAEYETEHPEQPFSTPAGRKLVLIYKRYATSLSNGHLCDNDNIEVKKTTNAIAEALHYSDNPEHFTMIYTTVEGPCNYLEATVIYQENLPEFLEYLHDSEPSQPIKMETK